MVPERYRGTQNLGNAVIAIDIAYRLGMAPLMVMQHLYVVHGTPAWSGQMVIALVNGSKLFKDPIAFEFRSEKGKDDWGCRAYAHLRSTGNRIDGPWVDVAMAKADGWWARNTKWQSMTELMLRYRAAAYFGRTVCPDVTLGLRAEDEERDYEPTPGTTVVDVPSLDAPPTTTQGGQPPLEHVIRVAKPRRVKTTAEAAAVLAGDPEVKPRVEQAIMEAKSAPPTAMASAADSLVAQVVAHAKSAPPAQQEPATEAADIGPDESPPIETTPPQLKESATAATPESVHRLELAEFIDDKLQQHTVDLGDFFDWLKGDGHAARFRYNADNMQRIDQLPMAQLRALTEPDALAPCIRKYGRPVAKG